MKMVYREIASLLGAIENCKKSSNTDWFEKHNDTLDYIERQYLPHGSGIDSGCKIDRASSNSERIVITSSFHMMNENGFYTGWKDFQVIIKASLQFGLDVRIVSPPKYMEDYLGDLFWEALHQEFKFNPEREVRNDNKEKASEESTSKQD